MPELQIIIPVRKGGNAYTTLCSLKRSTYQDFDITIVQDQWANANRARNEGFKLAGDSEFLLFSDDDIEWESDGIQWLVETLRSRQDVAFSYCKYEMNGRVYCDRWWDPQELRRRNYISTMSVIRRTWFLGWDDTLQRLHDWDLWLSIMQRGGYGLWRDEVGFRTAVRDGITHGGSVSYEEAAGIIRRKHGI